MHQSRHGAVLSYLHLLLTVFFLPSWLAIKMCDLKREEALGPFCKGRLWGCLQLPGSMETTPKAIAGNPLIRKARQPQEADISL
jgi:hypothetical protein